MKTLITVQEGKQRGWVVILRGNEKVFSFHYKSTASLIFVLIFLFFTIRKDKLVVVLEGNRKISLLSPNYFIFCLEQLTEVFLFPNKTKSRSKRFWTKWLVSFNRENILTNHTGWRVCFQVLFHPIEGHFWEKFPFKNKLGYELMND